jgi:glutaredoxin
MTKAQVIIYSRPGCHLCEEAKAVMASALCDEYYTLHEVNIESDSNLLERYRNDIPVITINGVEVFKHRLTAAEFRKKVAAD